MGAVTQAYTPAPIPQNEAERELAVIASGLLEPERAMALHAIVWRASRFFGASMASATILFRDMQRIIASTGIDVSATPRATSFCGHAILSPREVMCVPDAADDVRFAGNPYVVGEPHLRFYAAAPLLSAGGHALGALCVFDEQPRACLGPAEDAMLRRLAEQVMETSRRRTARH